MHAPPSPVSGLVAATRRRVSSDAAPTASNASVPVEHLALGVADTSDWVAGSPAEERATSYTTPCGRLVAVPKDRDWLFLLSVELARDERGAERDVLEPRIGSSGELPRQRWVKRCKLISLFIEKLLVLRWTLKLSELPSLLREELAFLASEWICD